MKTMTAIHDYYDRLAPDYDRDRFGNSYGRFVDAEERGVLRAWLKGTSPVEVVDIGCGTGRMLDFAMTGVDASAEMLKVAAGKFPGRRLVQSALPRLDLPDAAFTAATCLHVFMHLDEALIRASFAEIARVLKRGGRLIVDIPSSHRRSMRRRKASETGWHGETAASQADIERWAGARWRVLRRRGVLVFPIHRAPGRLRGLLRGADSLIGRTPLARWASYHLYELEHLA
jgi:SAM-dependent methyltransferase